MGLFFMVFYAYAFLGYKYFFYEQFNYGIIEFPILLLTFSRLLS